MNERRQKGKKVVIMQASPSQATFFKFEANKTYEVEVDLQRFPIIRKFKTKRGKEYWACIYNIRVLKENEKDINSDWMQRRIGVGNVHENYDSVIVEPRMYSEFWQLLEIQKKFGEGIHRCIVKTKAGNKGQVITRFKPAVSEYLKNQGRIKNNRSRSNPQELAERIREKVKEKAVTIKEIVETFKTDEKSVEEALKILVRQGYAVAIKDNKFYISS